MSTNRFTKNAHISHTSIVSSQYRKNNPIVSNNPTNHQNLLELSCLLDWILSLNYPSETLIRQFIKLRCVNLKYSRGVLFSNAFCSKTSVQTFFQTFQSIANTPDISKLCYLLVHFWFQTFQSFANTSHVSEVANISHLCVSNKRGTEKQMKLGGV